MRRIRPWIFAEWQVSVYISLIPRLVRCINYHAPFYYCSHFLNWSVNHISRYSWVSLFILSYGKNKKNVCFTNVVPFLIINKNIFISLGFPLRTRRLLTLPVPADPFLHFLIYYLITLPVPIGLFLHFNIHNHSIYSPYRLPPVPSFILTSTTTPSTLPAGSRQAFPSYNNPTKPPTITYKCICVSIIYRSHVYTYTPISIHNFIHIQCVCIQYTDHKNIHIHMYQYTILYLNMCMYPSYWS